MISQKRLGNDGEKIASNFLQTKGWQIIGRNVRTPFGELDLVGIAGHTILFAEVKTRSNFAYGEPEEAITPTKLAHIQKSSWWFLQSPLGRLYREFETRIDAISVHQGKVIRHIQNIEIT